MASAGQRAAEALAKVDAGVVPYFKEAAEKLLTQFADPAEALARALAQVTGHTKLRVCHIPPPYYSSLISCFREIISSCTSTKSHRL